MSEQTPSKSATPACEGKKLIIEVMGTAHPDPHTFLLYDKSDQQQQSWMEQQVEIDELDDQHLHCWPSPDIETKNVWLDIAGEDGHPVRVPLFRDLGETPRQMDQQWNRVWPIVPLTLIEDPHPLPGHPDQHAVPVRPGYIYIFREGVLWRELEVANGDDDRLAFRDVRLLDYRTEDGQTLSKDRRPTVGQPLATIWLPVQGMDRSVLDEFELAFSEVQWSADRVAYLEQTSEARSARCVQPAAPNPVERPSQPGQWGDSGQLSAMRLRESYLEQSLPRPWKSVFDLSGNHAQHLLKQAKEEQQALVDGGQDAETARAKADDRHSLLRGASAARAQALTSLHKTEDGSGAEGLWESLGEASNALSEVQENGWGTLVLDDQLFELRRFQTQTAQAEHYLMQLMDVIGQEPHQASAQVVHHVMGPRFLGGQENPLNAHLDNIDTGRFGPLHLTLRTTQRELAVRELGEAQWELTKRLQPADNQWLMADLFTLKGGDYIEGFALCRDLFQVLLNDPNRADTISVSGPTQVMPAQVEEAERLVFGIVEEGSAEPLHSMLFPTEESENQTATNGGNGRCRPKEVEALAQTLSDDDTPQTLTAVALVGLSQQDGWGIRSTGKRLLALVNSVLDGLDKSVKNRLRRLGQHAQQLNARVHGPLLRLAQARDPALLGEVRLMPRASVPQDWILLGVNDPDGNLSMGLTQADREYVHKTNGHHRIYGEFYKPDGTPLASTRKEAIPDVAASSAARETQIYAAPADAKIVKAHREMRGLTRWQDWADRVRVPYLVWAFEVWNLSKEAQLVRTMLREKGRVSAGFRVGSAFVDLAVASTFAVERLSKDLGVWRGLSRSLGNKAFEVNHFVLRKDLPSLARALPKVVTWRMLGGIISAGLTITVSTLDIIHEWDTGDDDAAAAHGVAVVGGGMTLMGSLMFAALGEGAAASSLALLGMGPIGWTAGGLALAVGGTITAFSLDDPPLVDWLKFGPFGDEQDDAYPHLRDNPAEVYYRLLSLLSRPRVVVESVRDLPVDLIRAGHQLDTDQERALSQINTCVSIDSNLSNFLDDTRMESHFRPVKISKTSTRRGLRVERETLSEPADVVLEQPLPGGKSFYLTLPPREAASGFWTRGESIHHYSVAVRSRWMAAMPGGNGTGKFVFPAPDLSNSLAYNAEEHGQPDFAEVDQPFWVDEQTHQPEDSS